METTTPANAAPNRLRDCVSRAVEDTLVAGPSADLPSRCDKIGLPPRPLKSPLESAVTSDHDWQRSPTISSSAKSQLRSQAAIRSDLTITVTPLKLKNCCGGANATCHLGCAASSPQVSFPPTFTLMLTTLSRCWAVFLCSMWNHRFRCGGMIPAHFLLRFAKILSRGPFGR